MSLGLSVFISLMKVPTKPFIHPVGLQVAGGVKKDTLSSCSHCSFGESVRSSAFLLLMEQKQLFTKVPKGTEWY